MTPEQINRAIAELCGTIRVDRIEADKEAGAIIVHPKCPDYFHSIDACAEFENNVPNDYYHRLAEVTHCDHLPGVEYPEPHFWRAFASATAPQRCEAFLRLHNRYKD